MQKYYVSFLEQKYIVLAKNPIDACIIVCKKYNAKTSGIDWKVSERGFNFHEDDEFVSDTIINKKKKGR